MTAKEPRNPGLDLSMICLTTFRIATWRALFSEPMEQKIFICLFLEKLGKNQHKSILVDNLT